MLKQNGRFDRNSDPYRLEINFLQATVTTGNTQPSPVAKGSADLTEARMCEANI